MFYSYVNVYRRVNHFEWDLPENPNEDTSTGWWFGTWLLFSPIAGMMIQSDFHIFQAG